MAKLNGTQQSILAAVALAGEPVSLNKACIAADRVPTRRLELNVAALVKDGLLAREEVPMMVTSRLSLTEAGIRALQETAGKARGPRQAPPVSIDPAVVDRLRMEVFARLPPTKRCPCCGKEKTKDRFGLRVFYPKKAGEPVRVYPQPRCGSCRR
jgi:hypothetical protein